MKERVMIEPLVENVLKEIEDLYRKYSLEKRTTTQPFILEMVREQFADYEYNPGDALVRESLIEHSGSLPIVATALFPHVDDEDVELGKALTMLAIHDVGELAVGDQNVFTKEGDGAEEHEFALKFLNPIYHELYKEVEGQVDRSKTARFAKAIDKITPDILDYLAPVDVTIWRYRYFTDTEREGIVTLIKKFKRPYMLWNKFMTDFHDYLMEELEKKIMKEAN